MVGRQWRDVSGCCRAAGRGRYGPALARFRCRPPTCRREAAAGRGADQGQGACTPTLSSTEGKKSGSTGVSSGHMRHRSSCRRPGRKGLSPHPPPSLPHDSPWRWKWSPSLLQGGGGGRGDRGGVLPSPVAWGARRYLARQPGGALAARWLPAAREFGGRLMRVMHGSEAPQPRQRNRANPAAWCVPMAGLSPRGPQLAWRSLLRPGGAPQRAGAASLGRGRPAGARGGAPLAGSWGGDSPCKGGGFNWAL